MNQHDQIALGRRIAADMGLSRRDFMRAAAATGVGAAVTGTAGRALAQPDDPTPDEQLTALAAFLSTDEALNELEYLPFAGLNSFMKLPYTRDLTDAQLVVMGIPFDSGTTYRSGSRFGARAIREQSGYAAAFRPVYPWTEDITDRYRVIDFGDVVALPGSAAVDLMLSMTEAVAARIFASGARLLSLGGDHTIPYGPVRAAAKQFGPLALIHIDSHQDSYSSDDLLGFRQINHGTFATDLAVEGHIDLTQSTQVYIRTIQPETPGGGYRIIYANEALAMTPEALAGEVRARIGDAPVYITLDIDALDPAFAPGNGSPVAGGPSTGEVRRFVQALAGLNVVAADIVEINPMFDPTGATAIAAATLGIDLLHVLGAGIAAS
jgi:agmatinase